MLYFLKIKIFISLDSCQFVEYLFKIKICIFQFLKTKKGDNVSFVYFYKITRSRSGLKTHNWKKENERTRRWNNIPVFYIKLGLVMPRELGNKSPDRS